MTKKDPTLDHSEADLIDKSLLLDDEKPKYKLHWEGEVGIED